MPVCICVCARDRSGWRLCVLLVLGWSSCPGWCGWLLVGGSTIERGRGRGRVRLLGAGFPRTPAAGKRSRCGPGRRRPGVAAQASRSAATASGSTNEDKQGAGSRYVSSFPFRGGLIFGRGFCGGCLLFADSVDWIFSIFGVFSLIWPHFLLIPVDYTSFAKIIEIWSLKMNFSKTFGDMGKSL